MHMHAKSLQSSLTLCDTMDYSCQDPLSMGLSRQECWSGLTCPPPGDLPNPGINPHLLSLLHWQTASLLLMQHGKSYMHYNSMQIIMLSLFSWKSCPTLCDPMHFTTAGFPVPHYLPEFVQFQVHWVGDAIQPSHPLSSPSPPALNLSQHQGLFQWVSPLHLVAKVLELQLQHQSFQWIFRVHFL